MRTRPAILRNCKPGCLFATGWYSADMSETGRAGVFHSNPEILGGETVFTGTRVPAKNLVDYLAAGETIDDFLEGFPSVSREQVIQFLEAAKEELLTPAR